MTRLYLCNTYWSDYGQTAPPTQGGWTATYTLVRTWQEQPSGSATASNAVDVLATNPNRIRTATFMTMTTKRAGLLGGVMSFAIGAKETQTAANAFLRLYGYILREDGTNGGTYLSARDFGAELTTAYTVRSGTNVGLSNVSVQAGDRIILEVGFSFANSVTTQYTATLLHGYERPTEDMPAIEGATVEGASAVGWVDIDFQQLFVPPPVDSGALLAFF